jgi:hypothetical protein
MKATFVEGNSGINIDLTELGFEFGFEDINRCAMVQMQLNFLVGRFMPVKDGVKFLLENGVSVTHELMENLHAVFSAVWGPTIVEYDLDDTHHVVATTGHRLSIK